MKCPGCKQQKKADNCQQCKVKIENFVREELENLLAIARGSVYSSQVISLLEKTVKKLVK
jgi:hypothetical protein